MGRRWSDRVAEGERTDCRRNGASAPGRARADKALRAGTVAMISNSQPEYFVAMFCEPQTGMDPASFRTVSPRRCLRAGRGCHRASRQGPSKLRRKRRAPSQLCLGGPRPSAACLPAPRRSAGTGWMALGQIQAAPLAYPARPEPALALDAAGAGGCRAVTDKSRCRALLALGDPDRAVHGHGVHVRRAWIDDGLDFPVRTCHAGWCSTSVTSQVRSTSAAHR